jgi:hypothetical protein
VQTKHTGRGMLQDELSPFNQNVAFKYVNVPPHTLHRRAGVGLDSDFKSSRIEL